MRQRHEGFGTGLKGRSPIGPRFWKKVIKGDEDECWNWMGTNLGKGNKGYGLIGYNGKLCLAHRVSWEIHNGSIPVTEGDRICVLHRCDNCKCVNPKHLFLGTQIENMKDRTEKGRNALMAGTRNPHAVLNEAQVRVIKRCCQLGIMKKKIAKIFWCHAQKISAIHLGHIWNRVKCLGDKSMGLDHLQLPP